jgi:hypothetical protein
MLASVILFAKLVKIWFNYPDGVKKKHISSNSKVM